MNAPIPSPVQASIRLLSLNIQCGIGMTRGFWQYATSGWKYALPHSHAPLRRLAKWITEQSIDVATFCEVESVSLRSGGADMAAMIAELTPLKHARYFSAHRVGCFINQGNAILTRYPILASASHRLPGAGEPRILCEAELETASGRVSVYTTHLSLSRNARREQFDAIAARLSACKNRCVLTGDFNTSNPEELTALSVCMRSAGAVRTFPSWNPTEQIDYGFVSAGVIVRGIRALDEIKVSDHLGVLMELTLN